MDTSDQPDRADEPDRADKPDVAPPSRELETASGPDVATIGLLVFFIALIGIVAALLLLPILAGGAAG